MTFDEWADSQYIALDYTERQVAAEAWNCAIEQEREECAAMVARMEKRHYEAVDNPMLAGKWFTPIADAIRNRM